MSPSVQQRNAKGAQIAPLRELDSMRSLPQGLLVEKFENHRFSEYFLRINPASPTSPRKTKIVLVQTSSPENFTLLV